jgi:hypothetical protein
VSGGGGPVMGSGGAGAGLGSSDLNGGGGPLVGSAGPEPASEAWMNREAAA